MKYNKFYTALLLVTFLNPIAFAQEKIDAKKKSDTEIILKDNAYIMTPIAAIGFAQWNWGNPEFRNKDEGFFQETSRYGGADKAGHFYSSYLISELLSKKFQNDGVKQDKAVLYGAASSLAVTTLIEIGDATSPEQGFSYQDEVMNALGAASSYILLLNPKLDKKIDLKIDYFPTANPFKSDGRLVDDYDGARYIASLKFSGFDATKNTALKFFELQAIYSATGYIKNDPSRSRNIGIGIGLNINEIIDFFSDGKNNKYVEGFFEYYQPRYSYVSYDENLNE